VEDAGRNSNWLSGVRGQAKEWRASSDRQRV